MKLDDMGVAFPQECLRAAYNLLAERMGAGGAFHYLNHYARKDYFRIWTLRELFHMPFWLTLSLGMGDATPGSLLFTVNSLAYQCPLSCLLCGQHALSRPAHSAKIGGRGQAFLSVWILASPQLMKGSAAKIHLPVFILLGLGGRLPRFVFFACKNNRNLSASACCALGILLWVIYVGSYPFARDYSTL